MISIDKECKECALSSGCAIGGIGPADLSKVKLIVVSDHTGHYEQKHGYPFASNDSVRSPRRLRSGKTTLLGPRNAGSMIRHLIRNQLSLDDSKEVYYTNVVKCFPGKNKAKEKEAKVCTARWFVDELSVLDSYVPSAPILIAGTLAFKALAATYKDSSFSKSSLKACRRTSTHHLLEHPVFFAYNPATIAKCEWMVEDTSTRHMTGSIEITSKQQLPNFPLSPLWIYTQDLIPLDRVLNPAKYKSSDILF